MTADSRSLYFGVTFGEELVAGKLIEILSTMVVCPLFYVLTLLRLLPVLCQSSSAYACKHPRAASSLAIAAKS